MTQLGYFVVSGSSVVVECMANTSIDWIVLDREASVAQGELVHDLMALRGSKVKAFVRVAKCDRSEIEHALDLGAQGIIVPKVDSVEQARMAVEACYYPPLGNRGINPVRATGYFKDVNGYLKNANSRVECFVQIESVSALENLGEIAAVKGISGLFIGCGDLASSLGQPGNVEGPKMDRACRQVIAACQLNQITPGIFAYSLNLARRYKADGFEFIALGNDLKSLRSSIEQSLIEFHKDEVLFERNQHVLNM